MIYKNIYKSFFMTIKELLKNSGVTLQDVADGVGLSVSKVCQLLDEETIDSVRQHSLGLVRDRTEFLRQGLNAIEAKEGIEARPQHD
jgi:transcriptional regulator with XRE-family HTH domain